MENRLNNTNTNTNTTQKPNTNTVNNTLGQLWVLISVPMNILRIFFTLKPSPHYGKSGGMHHKVLRLAVFRNSHAEVKGFYFIGIQYRYQDQVGIQNRRKDQKEKDKQTDRQNDSWTER